MQTKVIRSFHRNGQLRVETHIRGRTTVGLHRTWYSNGKLATEQRFQNGLLHGVCRQWNNQGKLLGSFHMNHGTGIQKEWFENGRLQLETSTVNGEFTGRTRVWLLDGTLVSEQFAIENRNVSPAAYAAATIKNPDFPHYRLRAAKVNFPDEEEIERREFQLQVRRLLRQPNRKEAMAWLSAGAGLRSLGLFKFPRALRLVRELYEAGAIEVMVASIYPGKSGRQFSDAILVRLPSKKPIRNTIRRLLEKLPAKLRAGVLPATDQDEKFLFAGFA